MKRILIFSHAMELGGAERVLLGLLEAIDTTRCDVDLFLMRHEGELFKDIPAKIHLLPEIPQYACLAIPINQVLRQGQFDVAYGRLCGKLKASQRKRKLGIVGENDIALEYSHKYTECFMPDIGRGDYDLAISFLTPHYFVRDKVIAKKKIAWIHTDYSKVAIDRESQLPMWSGYDQIISISDQVTESFLGVFPELTDKVKMIPHFMPVQFIRKEAERMLPSDFAREDSSIRLLSIGRFCYAKNFDNVPDICRRIRQKGIDVKWYLIGYGSDEPLIRKRIEECGMQNYVVILGKKENPYPYIKACDLYVQPSRYEGKCVSVIEAQILGKPVVITNYPTAQSQLIDGENGRIVPSDNEGCSTGISSLLQNPDDFSRLKNNCSQLNFSGSEGINYLYSLSQ